MLSSDFDYPLPPERIAQKPLGVRDACRLCVVDRGSGEVLHRKFSDLADFLEPGDLLVLNNSRVVRARVPCRREGTGGAVEVFLLDPPGAEGKRRFKALFGPAKKARVGERLLPERNPDTGGFKVVADPVEGEGEVEWDGSQPLDALALEPLGVVPLPPYINRERIPDDAQEREDARLYQTVFARHDGSSAAPTAGLHFTERLIARLRAKGVKMGELTLHVGAGTFLPVKSEDLDQHTMHSEAYMLPEALIRQIQDAKSAGRRVIPVGTTALRALESAYFTSMNPDPGWRETAIFIKPGFQFKISDALITNFHQPKSTLLALVSAFWDREKLLSVYAECANKKYRFLSYGDAMLLR